MLKKLAIGSAVLLLACMLIVAALLPVAIEDTVTMAESLTVQYEQMILRQTIMEEGVKTLELRGGYHTQLILRKSPDANIYVYTDDYDYQGGEREYQYNRDTGHLTIYNYWRSNTGLNPWRTLGRENILKGVVQLFAVKGVTMELWLPEGVAFDTTSVYHVKTVDGVETYMREAFDEPMVDTLASSEQEENLEEQEEQEELHRAEQAQLLLEYSSDLVDLYARYSNYEIEENIVFTENLRILSESADILTKYGEDDGVSAGMMLGYLQRIDEENILYLNRHILMEQYVGETITKEDFYSRDLELDRAAKSLETREQQTDMQVNNAIDSAERILGVDTCFGEILFEDLRND